MWQSFWLALVSNCKLSLELVTSICNFGNVGLWNMNFPYFLTTFWPLPEKKTILGISTIHLLLPKRATIKHSNYMPCLTKCNTTIDNMVELMPRKTTDITAFWLYQLKKIASKCQQFLSVLVHNCNIPLCHNLNGVNSE